MIERCGSAECKSCLTSVCGYGWMVTYWDGDIWRGVLKSCLALDFMFTMSSFHFREKGNVLLQT